MNRMRVAIEESALTPAELSAGAGQQIFQFAEDFIGFAGHFPNYPILPAVLQLLMAQQLAEKIVGLPLEFMTLERAKFSHELRPGDQVDVRLSCREKQGQLHCASELWLADRRAASFTLVLRQGTDI